MSDQPNLKPESESKAPETKPKDESPKPEDSKLGDAGKKALESEREARKKAEQQLTQLSNDFQAFKDGLGGLLGTKPESDSTEDALKALQSSLGDIQRENAVLAAANQHGITDEADLAILRGSTATGDAFTALAVRLAPSEDASKPGTPKPDKSQGAKGDPGKPEPSPGVPRLAQALEEEISGN